MIFSTVVFLLVSIREGNSAAQNGIAPALQLTILHTNDIHSHIEESTIYGGVCSDSDKKDGKCVGGVTRITAKVKELKKTHQDALFFNAGDFYQGTAWYSILKHVIVSAVMGNMSYDYVCLGNHEFDDGPKGLAPFLMAMNKSNVVVVNTNADFDNDTNLKDIYVHKSVTIEKNNTKIGILGAVLHETAHLSNPGNVTFRNDLESIREEAEKLYAQGVKVIIAVTHSGYTRDIEIAKEVPHVDLVVGGHTNTFLYTGSGYPPENKPEGDYPTVVNKTGGGVGLVVQDYWFGKFLGFLQVGFDKEGKPVSWNGDPILINASDPEDENMSKIVNKYKPNVTRALGQRVGFSKVYLEQQDNICRLRECNLGNLMTDAYFAYYADKNSTDPTRWSDVNGAVLNGGTIRAPLPQGVITLGDVMQTAPFGQTIEVVSLYGKYLQQMFEHSVANYSYKNRKGQFLQVSGPLDLDVLVAYINKTSPIKTPVEGRITIYGNITKDD
ncbi:protein 5NUC-like isoform X2 [Haemaphysalis longicornis]